MSCAVLLYYIYLTSLLCQGYLLDNLVPPEGYSTRKIYGGVVIESNVLETILNRDPPLRYDGDHNETFLSMFNEYWIPFKFDQDENTKVFQMIAERNKNIFDNSTPTISVSFQPRADILEDLRLVTNVVRKANAIYPGTVSTIIANYGYLLVDRESIPLVNHDIVQASREIREQHDPSLRLAIQMDSLNCRNRNEYLDRLELQGINLIIFTPSESSRLTVENALDIMYEIHLDGCANKFLDKWKEIGVARIQCPPGITLDINLKEGYFYFIGPGFRFTANTEPTSDIGAVFYAKVRHADAKSNNVNLGIKNFDNWIHQPNQFSKSNLGAVIKTEKITDSFVPNILRDFSKVGIRDTFLDMEKSMVKQFMLKILNASIFTVDQQKIPLEISLYVHIKQNNFNINKEQVNHAVSLAAVGNEFLPGGVRSLIIDWTDCFSSANCSGYRLKGSKCRYLKTVQEDMIDLLLYSANVINTFGKVDTEFAVGSIFDHTVFSETYRLFLNDENCTFIDQYLENYTTTDRKNENYTTTDRTNENYTTTDPTNENYIMSSEENEHSVTPEQESVTGMLKKTLLCGSTILYKDLEAKGVDKTVTRVVGELNRCRALHYGAAIYNVKVLGCDHSNSNMNTLDLAAYALLLETLNNWAVSAKAVLFVDAGIENQDKCSGQQQNSSKEICSCGWWKNFQSVNGPVLLNKKEIALELHKHTTSPRSPPLPKNMKEVLLYTLIPAFLVTVFVTTLTVILVHRYRSKDIISKQQVAAFVNGSSRRGTNTQNYNQTGEDGYCTAESEPFNIQKYEMAPSSFTIDKTRCLGSGEFGKVFRATINQRDVQVETAVKVNNTPDFGKGHSYYMAIKGLISEIKILSYVGDHKQIVTLLGTYTAKLRKGNIAVFLELCHLGSLDKYLRSYVPQSGIGNGDDDNHGANGNRGSVTSISDHERTLIEMETFSLGTEMLNDLCRWAGEITCGMKFLASKKLVHADLATRNILLTSDKVAKISDFGLSRRLYDYSEYVKKNQCPLPWRWMAPESLNRSIFTEKSDVWAFGVTLWEMFTLGDEPYPGLAWNPNFPAMLQRGLRLNEPRYNTGVFYEVMKRCWNDNPALRPTFDQLDSELNEGFSG